LRKLNERAEERLTSANDQVSTAKLVSYEIILFISLKFSYSELKKS